MGFLQSHIYPHLPLPLQNLAISAYGYQWNRRRFGGIFEQELRGFKERERYTTPQWRDYQTIQLRKLLIHAFETVPYYHRVYNELGFNADTFSRFELEDLSKLPYLEKNTLRQLGTTDLLSRKREKGGAFFASSGSTGTPTSILYSHAFHQRWSAAFEARIRHWAGVDRFTPRGMIGGRRVLPEGVAKAPFFRYNFIEKQVYFSAYHISRYSVNNYLEGIQKYGLQYMTGYAMSNWFLARFLEEENLEAPALKAVITSSEKLTDEMRRTFQKVYHCKTYDSYSGVEACGLISENAFGQLLISPDVGIIEVLREDGSSSIQGESGEAVCTGLLNFDQPLIRYRIGDLFTIGEDSPMPIIREIIGRAEDTVIGADGREIVRFHGIFINLPNIIKGQIIQQDYRQFVINIETLTGLTTQEKAIIYQRMRSQLGEIDLQIKEMKEIPLSANGKFKAVISNIKRTKVFPDGSCQEASKKA